MRIPNIEKRLSWGSRDVRIVRGHVHCMSKQTGVFSRAGAKWKPWKGIETLGNFLPGAFATTPRLGYFLNTPSHSLLTLTLNTTPVCALRLLLLPHTKLLS